MAAGLDATVIEPHLVLEVSRLRLPAGHEGRLAKALAGSRVVHLTDLHVHGMGIKERRLAKELESLRPDMLLMTGDYAEGPDGMEALRRVLGSVKPSRGAFAVMGNNDHNRGQRAQIEKALSEAGVQVLDNRSVVVRAPGGPVVVAGVDDPHYGRDDLVAAMAETPHGVPVILLAHSPDLLRRKGRGLLINPGDERGPWKRGWWWQDGAHTRSDTGEVLFPSTGKRKLRVQHREDGVAVDEIRLVPEPAGAGGARPALRRGRVGMPAPQNVPGSIVVKASQVAEGDIQGGWVKLRKGLSDEIEDDWMLVNGPDRGINQTYAQVEPASYFDAEFEAAADVRYHVWAHVRSSNNRGSSDSIYLQFTDSLNAEGRPDYRIGAAVPGVDASLVDLMLAGHTHGGQVRAPFYGAIEPNVRRVEYLEGMHQVEGMSLHVGRGAGWSYLPVRLLCPPELTVFEAGREGRDASSF